MVKEYLCKTNTNAELRKAKENARNNANSIGCNNSHANLDIPSI